jgi:hypothetical protein
MVECVRLMDNRLIVTRSVGISVLVHSIGRGNSTWSGPYSGAMLRFDYILDAVLRCGEGRHKTVTTDILTHTCSITILNMTTLSDMF